MVSVRAIVGPTGRLLPEEIAVAALLRLRQGSNDALRVLMLAERQEFVEDEIDCAEREKPDEIGKGFLKPDAFDQKKDDGKLHDVGASVGCKK